MVRVELKPCSTTSVEYFSTPLWSVHLRVCNAPSRYTLAPFFRYCSATLASPSLKITTRCHSVFSLRSPVALSRQLSEVATLRLAMARPSWVRRISGSLPRFPTRITLFTLPAIATLHAANRRRSNVSAQGLGPNVGSLFGSHDVGRPYTLARPRAGPRDPALLLYPHIAPQSPMFQFCSTKSAPIPACLALQTELAAQAGPAFPHGPSRRQKNR